MPFTPHSHAQCNVKDSFGLAARHLDDTRSVSTVQCLVQLARISLECLTGEDCGHAVFPSPPTRPAPTSAIRNAQPQFSAMQPAESMKTDTAVGRHGSEAQRGQHLDQISVITGCTGAAWQF